MEDDEEAPREKPAAAPAPKINKQASKKRVKFDGGEDEDVEIEDDFRAPAAGAAAGGVVTRRSANPAQASKKMKVDDTQEVSALFASSIRFEASPIDISVKKFVYRLISEVQN
jgi:hypothetical protein